ncbi:MAG: FAD-dependent oxidoreductase [Candidatus Brocadiia bacterium]
MSEGEWTQVADEGELEEGQPLSVKVGKQSIMLVRLGDRIHACGGKCTHYGAPLADGLLVEGTIVCPWHSARFDVSTGRMEAPPALDHAGHYPVKVEDGAVYVGPKEEPQPAEREPDDRTFVILGGGAGGNAAAETLRAAGFGGRVVMVTAEQHVPYDRPTLSKEFMSGEAPAKWLPLRSEKFYDRRDIELLTGRQVAGLDTEAMTIIFEDGEELACDAVLLASGGVPRTLDLPGADLDGVFTLRSRADAERIADAAEDAESVVIIGAGFIGMEVASALCERGLAVHVVAPEQVPLARVFGEQIGAWLMERHEEEGVVFHLGTTAAEIRGGEGVEAVVLEDGTELAADMVLVGVGIRPAVGFLEGAGLVVDGAVPVDETLMTEAEGVYAIGDIAVVPDPHTGEGCRVEHWIVAERQGQHAARAMLGDDSPYGEVPFFWTHQAGVSLKYVGYAPEWDRLVFRGDLEDGKFLAGYYQNGALRAAAGVGRGNEILAVAEALRRAIEVPAEAFADQDCDLCKPVPEP